MPNFIVLCARVRACYKKREHIWLVQAKKIPNVLLKNRETPMQEIGRVGNPEMHACMCICELYRAMLLRVEHKKEHGSIAQLRVPQRET